MRGWYVRILRERNLDLQKFPDGAIIPLPKVIIEYRDREGVIKGFAVRRSKARQKGQLVLDTPGGEMGRKYGSNLIEETTI